MRFALLISAVLCLSINAGAQSGQKKKIELIRADNLRFDESLGSGAQRLIGNVKFRHLGAIMTCDSAYLYEKTNSLKAWGDVEIQQGDTLFLYGDTLDYNGDRRYAQIRGDIKMLDRDMTLTTQKLDYNLAKNTGLYYKGGKIISKANNNVLVSKLGYYYANDNQFFFKDSVRLTHPDYTMFTDTLRYNTITEVAYFLGPTRIISDQNTIYCENGWYDTQKDLAQFNDNAEIRSKPYILNGDSLFYDRNKGFGEAFQNVQLNDTTSSYLLSGNYGSYQETQGTSYVTDRALMVQYGEGDSLFLHADTLKALKDSLKGNKMLAYHNVRIYRQNLQGKCDSLSYNENDSLMVMYHQPVLWSEENQITGDTISITMNTGSLKEMRVRQTAFIISQADSNKFNQIKGRRIIGHFTNNQLSKMDVIGNGQSIYYAEDKAENKNGEEAESGETNESGGTPDAVKKNKQRDESENSEESDAKEKTFLGVNKAECSNITIYVKENQIQRIAFLTKPNATFFPLDDFPDEQRKMKDFKWAGALRPKSKEDLF